jgi:predicted permease
MNIFQTLNSTLPVLLIIALGFFLNRRRLVKPETILDLKSLIVNVTLPLVLFRAFGTMVFEFRYLFIVAIVFFACTAVMLLTTSLKNLPGLRSRYAPFLMAGFEAGMLGYAVFSSIFGEANVPVFAVIDLGQVVFVFFVLVTRLQAFEGQRQSWQATVGNFFRTPVIIAILAGVIFNISGIYDILGNSVLGQTFLATLGILAGLTTPLVAIVIGYGLNFKAGRVSAALQTVFLRLLVWVSLALLINHFIIRQWFQLDRIFEAAVLLMFILPAPFVIPLYSRSSDETDQDYILNTLSIGTLAALVGVIVIRLFYA